MREHAPSFLTILSLFIFVFRGWSLTAMFPLRLAHDWCRGDVADSELSLVRYCHVFLVYVPYVTPRRGGAGLYGTSWYTERGALYMVGLMMM